MSSLVPQEVLLIDTIRGFRIGLQSQATVNAKVKKQAVPMTLLMFDNTERLTYSVCLTQMLHNYNY